MCISTSITSTQRKQRQQQRQHRQLCTMCSSTADTSLRLAPDSGGLVAINSWTLCFSDPHLEQQFKVHQLHVWGCTKLWRLRMNLLAAVVNFSITIYLLSLVSLGTGRAQQRLYGTRQIIQ